MLCSIFMASITASTWPRVTASPTCTAKDTTLPGMGALRRPPSACASPAWASVSTPRIWVAPQRVKTCASSPLWYTCTWSRRVP